MVASVGDVYRMSGLAPWLSYKDLERLYGVVYTFYTSSEDNQDSISSSRQRSTVENVALLYLYVSWANITYDSTETENPCDLSDRSLSFHTSHDHFPE
jgi:hypothetical protein